MPKIFLVEKALTGKVPDGDEEGRAVLSDTCRAVGTCQVCENYNLGSQHACMNPGLLLLQLSHFRADLGKISTARWEPCF